MSADNEQAQCAHMTVRYAARQNTDGQMSGSWACKDCGAGFVPSRMYDIAMRCGYHLCTLVADNAASAVRDLELREVARDRIREHITEAFEKKALG